MKRIAILGSTGSIGTQTLDVIERLPGDFRVVGLAAGKNAELLLKQAERFRPKVVSVADRAQAEWLAARLPAGVRALYGPEGLLEVAAGCGADLVVGAMVGSAGLAPTLAAIEAGAAIGLANKETLVAAGHIVTRRAAERGVPLLPMDSEHSAIFQCLQGEDRKTVKRLLLTASGGSFRDRRREELARVTVEEALRHPNWSMGAKITIDSATMANKGLEVIEAHWLFGVPYDRIEVLLHPESIVHSLVEFADSSVLAQLGLPDMRGPIQYALCYPERKPSPMETLDLARIGALHFRPADFARYPCLGMAYEAGRTGGTAPAVFNAANEVTVARFLRGEIPFLAIEDIIENVLSRHKPQTDPDLETILACDEWARREAAAL